MRLTRVQVRPGRLAGVVSLALASAVLIVAALAGTARAAYRGLEGRIAFARNGNIYTIEPNGTGLRQLTSGGGRSGPRWSPDGTRVAYLDKGNLWIMNANGSHQAQVTSAAPGYTDARPSWSPNGRYLAFVRTRRHSSYGYLTRYDTMTRRFATFSTPYHSEHPTRRQIKVTALPSAVAWGWARNATRIQFGSFIIFEGAKAQCPVPYTFCLDALGFGSQGQYRNGYPSAEYLHSAPIRLTDPDWFPINPLFSTDVMTTQGHCAGGHCTPTGLDLAIGASPVVAGAYQGVYSPTGHHIAYARNVRGLPEIYVAVNNPFAPPGGSLLTQGTEPDWQPVGPFPPA